MAYVREKINLNNRDKLFPISVAYAGTGKAGSSGPNSSLWDNDKGGRYDRQVRTYNGDFTLINETDYATTFPGTSYVEINEAGSTSLTIDFTRAIGAQYDAAIFDTLGYELKFYFQYSKEIRYSYDNGNGSLTNLEPYPSINADPDQTDIDIAYRPQVHTLFIPSQELKKIRISVSQFTISNFNHRFYELELYHIRRPHVEFDDSLLESKAWNSSRYDGRQLNAKKLNEYNNNDISFANTPVISNVTRTFYVVGNVISLDSNNQSIISKNPGNEENEGLHTIPGFSYIKVTKAITVNDDNSIESQDLLRFPNTNVGNRIKKGLERQFRENIKIKDEINIIDIREDSNNNLKDSYNVFYNEGILKELIRVSDKGSSNLNSLAINSTGTVFNPFSQASGYSTTFNTEIVQQNKGILNQYYTGSLDVDEFKTGGSGPIVDLFDSLSSNVNQDNRFFISLGSGSEDTSTFEVINVKGDDQLVTIGNTNYANSGDLKQLSTFEIKTGYNPTAAQGTRVPIKGSPTAINSSTNNGNNSYTSIQQYNSSTAPSEFISGSYSISYLDQNLSILTDLNKSIELPNGVNNSTILVLPSNLHPYIKDNIEYFALRAGLSLGGQTSPVVKLDETNLNLF